MKWRTIRKIARIIGSIVGLCIFSYLVHKSFQQFKEISSPININSGYILLSFVLAVLTYFLQIINFKLIYTSLRQRISLPITTIGYAFSFLPKYVPGYVWGYYSRADWFEEKAKIRGVCTWFASALEVLITVCTSLSIWLAYYFQKTTRNTWVLLILLIPFLIVIPLNKFLQLLKKYSRTEKTLKNIEAIPIVLWTMITINSYIQWILFGVGLWALSQSFEHTKILNVSKFIDFIYSFSRSWLSGFLTIFIPNGLGVREFVLNDLLIDVNNVNMNLSVIMAATSRLLMLFAEVFWLILSIFLNRYRKNKKYNESIIDLSSN